MGRRLALGISISATASTANAFTPLHIHLPQHILATSSTCLLGYQKDDQDGGSTDNFNSGVNLSGTSIGDVVQNLHGGKYQFSETQYLAGSSVMGQQFAESLYSSDDGAGCDQIVADEEEELPKWARILQDPVEQCNKPILDTLTFNGENRAISISIKNDERSWERYYAFVLGDDDGLLVQVSPQTGSLAPRGGASNVCDETKPYSDSATISIEWFGQGDLVTGAKNNEGWLLVVGTEAEVWRYRLRIIAM